MLKDHSDIETEISWIEEQASHQEEWAQFTEQENEHISITQADAIILKVCFRYISISIHNDLIIFKSK